MEETWGKIRHGNHRGLAVIAARSGTMLFAALVDIDVYDASGNIVHIAGRGRGGLVARCRLLGRRVPGSKTDSTEDPPCVGSVASLIIRRGPNVLPPVWCKNTHAGPAYPRRL
ncbi:hypothetical protein AVEN_165804-1 [Araneus ventricosus]|uniref:Uncharacterized protein n=1 Tax=Araneus ventricosus TaxID=182803 RepID=A0A4Y2ELR2_ARAVE|nr:hypothetical protein AVEN_165804-1 [Araneus ventricosus]